MGEGTIGPRDATTRIRCADDMICEAISIYVLRRRQLVGNGPEMLEMLDATWKTIGPVESTYISEPTMKLAREHAQALMDELWSCGLRPKEGAGSAGAMAATKEHLKDLQKLVDRFVVPGRQETIMS